MVIYIGNKENKKMQYKVKFKTVLDYWKSKPYRSIIVEAEKAMERL